MFIINIHLVPGHIIKGKIAHKSFNTTNLSSHDVLRLTNTGLEVQKMQPYTVIIYAYDSVSMLPEVYNVSSFSQRITFTHLQNGIGTFSILPATQYQNGRVTAIEEFGKLLENRLHQEQIEHKYVEYPYGPDYGEIDTGMIIGIPKDELLRCIDMLSNLFIN